jgi:glutamine cyclotransferase
MGRDRVSPVHAGATGQGAGRELPRPIVRCGTVGGVSRLGSLLVAGLLLSQGVGVSSCSSSPGAERASPAASAADSAVAEVPVYGYEVVHSYPHDPAAFTQGLAFADGVLYEGTGLYGESTLRQVDLETGSVLQSRSLPPQYFGEGIAVYGDRIVQLTWRSRVGFVYDRRSFGPIHQFAYRTEGWGLTHDGRRLILSDGTATLYVLDPQTYEVSSSLQVRDRQSPVSMLNELEYVEGEIYANVWQTDRIARISPATGRVLGWIDLTGLLKAEDLQRPADVLNGIAYDSVGRRLFVTGKWWPRLFEIRLVRRSG